MVNAIKRYENLRRKRERMQRLRDQLPLPFSPQPARFPVLFPRAGRVVPAPVAPPPRNWYRFFCSEYGFFPKFRKLPVIDPRNRLEGWEFFRAGDGPRGRFAWSRHFLDLVRDYKMNAARMERYT